MRCISPKTNLLDIPNIGFWFTFQDFEVITPNLLARTIETVEGTDGTVNRHGLEILIRKETDGKWRVLQERILADNEMEFDKRKQL